MLFVLWLILRLLTRLLVLPDANDRAKDLEILVLRHQLRVLRRKTGRPKFTAADRVLLAAASRVLPRQRWASTFLVTPQTLLRWHRTLVRRKWTYGKKRTPGRPPTDSEVVALVLLFFIQLSTRRVLAAGVTAHPDSAWVTQQARNAAMELGDRGMSIRFLLGDHDAKFSRSFDVFCSEGVKVIRTPVQAPKANAYAERWVQTVRAECLDWTLVLGRRHLLRLLRAYVRHDNEQRPHRGLALAVPEAWERDSPRSSPREVRRRNVLGGLIHEYHEVAA